MSKLVIGGVDFTNMMKSSIPMSDVNIVEPTPQKKTRKKKEENINPITIQDDTVVPDNNIESSINPEVLYLDTYDETNKLLKQTIYQLDVLSGEIKGDIDHIRANKLIKNKYTYLTNMNTTMSGLLSTKINAIKEINSSINNSHNLELKRMKDLASIHKDQENNDDKKIMDLYNAFIHTPMSSGMTHASVLGPTVDEVMLIGGSNIDRVSVGGNPIQDMNISPEQNRMRMENNPNIETVVVFNTDTGERYFDVIDITTGQSVPNYPRPAEFLLENTGIDVGRGVARNSKLDINYKLIVIGNTPNITEY